MKNKICEIFPGIRLFFFFLKTKAAKILLFLIAKRRKLPFIETNFIFVRKQLENIKFKNLIQCSQYFTKEMYKLSANKKNLKIFIVN